jgi:hypothetical protein
VARCSTRMDLISRLFGRLKAFVLFAKHLKSLHSEGKLRHLQAIRMLKDYLD